MPITKEEAIKAMETGQMVVPERFPKGMKLSWIDSMFSVVGIPTTIKKVQASTALLTNGYWWPLLALTFGEPSNITPMPEQPYKRELTKEEAHRMSRILRCVSGNDDYRFGFQEGFEIAVSSLPLLEEIKAMREEIKTLTEALTGIGKQISQGSSKIN